MKFIINKDYFNKALANVCRIIPPNPIQHILSSLKLTLNSDGLNLLGSNGDISISQTIPLFDKDKEIIRDIQQGAILVDARIIFNISRKMSGDELVFELLDNSVAKISNDRTTFKLNTMREEEYIDVDLSEVGTEIEIGKSEFINAVNEVAFAASTKEVRPLLTAVNFSGEENTLTLTATDGSRLAAKKIFIQVNEKISANIMSKTLIEAIKGISGDGIVKIYISDKKILINLGDSIIVSRLIPGEYPNTKNIVPKSFFYFLEVNAEEFLNAMDRVSLLSDEKENIVTLIMTESKIEVTSKSQQNGSAVETLSLFKYQGERLEISFNYDFVSSAIKALKSEDVLLSFIGEMKPFTVTNKADENIIQLITPVRNY